MKKHFSVFMLSARRSVGWYIPLLIITAIAEAAAFYAAAGQGQPSFEYALDASHLPVIFLAAFLLVCVILCLPGCLHGGQGYTVRRFAVPRLEVFFWQWLHNSICFLVLWAFQAAAALGLYQLWLHLNAGAVSPQEIFLAFYRNDLLHAVLPLDETSRWVQNALLVPALGAATALLPLTQQRGRRSGWAMTAYIAVVTALFFTKSAGNFISDMFLSVSSIAVLAAAPIYAAGITEDPDEET